MSGIIVSIVIGYLGTGWHMYLYECQQEGYTIDYKSQAFADWLFMWPFLIKEVEKKFDILGQVYFQRAFMYITIILFLHLITNLLIQ